MDDYFSSDMNANLVNVVDDPSVDISSNEGFTTLIGGSSEDVDDPSVDISSDEGFTAPVEILNPAQPGEAKYGWKMYTNGVSISPGGKYYLNDKMVYDPDNLNLGLGKGKSMFTDKDGNVKLSSLLLLGTGLYSFLGNDGSFLGSGSGSGSDSAGWSTPVPDKVAVRERVEQPERKAGEPIKGRRYFTDTKYLDASDTEGIAAAKEQAKAQALELKQQPFDETKVVAGVNKIPIKWNKPEVKAATQTTQTVQNAGLPAIPNAMEIAQQTYPQVNAGSIAQDQSGIGMGGGLAAGGIANMRNPRYLRGNTDGMADKIPSSIDGKHPAALSHGEFVIPADVVAHLGNGNSDAGAKKLYDMMARVRKARTGTTKQGKKINPDKFMPGGLAALASGGDIRYFNNGGATSSGVTSGGASGGVQPDTSTTSTLSPWAGKFVTDALSEASALAKQPYQEYKGTLVAGPSDLQKQAFTDVGNLASAGFDPTTYTTDTFDASQANKYMNPYLMASLNPQLQELRRQSQINQQTLGGKFGGAGVFGGGRHAIAEAENTRNLLGKQADVLGTGYATAFDKAMQQFNTEQGRSFDAAKASEESRKASADYGLKTLAEMSRLGQIQRDIEAEKVAADKAAFEEERGWEYKMPQYKLSLLGGLPTGSKTSSTDMSGIQGILSNVSGMAALMKLLGLSDD